MAEQKNSYYNVALICTLIALLMAFAAGCAGAFYNQIYRDNELVRAVWQGNDFVTFVIAVPMTLLATLKCKGSPHNHLKAFLVWMGGLWYMIYNYVFYMYGAAFNSLFLAYVAIVILSATALIHGFICINGNLSDVLHKPVPDNTLIWPSNFLIGFASLLGGAWVIMASSFLWTGQVPMAILQTGHPTGVVFATDLVFLVSPLLVLGIYLRQSKRWAALLSAVLLVKCCLYPLVFVVAGLIAYQKTGFYDILTPVYIILGLLSAISLNKILRIID